ncbi:MAG: LapA family protein, partial [Alphaproteobacteria bacterium]|nr:LapA family protein [Alphaproteobacteria bacterium]
MEQNPDLVSILVGWVAEELVALAVGSVIGAIGAKWFFGKKNTEELRRLRREVDELKRERDRQASPSSPASAPVPRDDGSMDRPAKSLKQPAATPAPRDDDSKNRSHLPGSNVPDALLSPEELMALVKGRTKIVADRMLQPHKGRRHHVRGAIRDVSDFRSDGVEVALDGEDGT